MVNEEEFFERNAVDAREMCLLPEVALIISHQLPQRLNNLGWDLTLTDGLGVDTRMDIATHKGVFALQEQLLANATHRIAVMARKGEEVEL